MINIGFIGVGGMGRYQANSFKQLADCKVAAGSDLAEPYAHEFAAAHPDAAVYANHKELLANPKIDAVVVAVPTGFHHAVVLDAIKAGRPVLVEKPMARTVRECREMIDAADRAKKLLMVAHCRRFDTDWGTFADTYRSGALGEKVLWRDVRGGIGPRTPWFMDDRLGGGPLMDGAIHNQDFANLLFGEADHVIGSEIKFDKSCTAIDTGTAIVQYKNGSQLMLCWSWAVQGLTVHDVMGEKATFVFGPAGQTVPEGSRAHTLLSPDGTKKLLLFQPKDMYVTQARHFFDCIDGRAECASPATEAIKAVAVAEAVLTATRQGTVCAIDRD